MEKQTFLNMQETKQIDIEFNNVVFSVKQKGSVKQILKGVSGKFKSGELTAILGPSGAGKSSLLNILTGSQITGTTGTIKCDGNMRPKNGALQYKKESCYILQDDHLAPLFTAYEIMSIAARLKIKDLSEKSKDFLIDTVLNTIGLLNCKNTRCGNLSGGQRKRLSIALELIDNPPIMFLDEPTTGLDSLSTTQCVKILTKLAREGRTIICTIHQPSASVYSMFDHVYVLAEGRCVYQGSNSNTVPFLFSVGFECPKFHNPADYLLEVCSGEYGKATEILSNAAADTKWRNSIHTKKKKDNELEICQKEPIYSIDSGQTSEHLVPSELARFWILLCRQGLQLYRDWTISQLKLLLHLLVGIFLGMTFQNIGMDGSKTINNVGFFMCSAVYLCYTSLMPAVLKFPSEMSILRKESFNNWFKLRTYYAAFLVADIPMQVMFAVAYTSTSYFMSGQPQEWTRFIMVLGMQCLIALVASSMGLVFGTLVDPVNGTFLGAIATALTFCVAGFLILFTHMSKPMYLLSYISYLSFAMEGVMQAVYGYGRSNLKCPEDVEYCLYASPKELLKDVGMSKENYWVDIGYLLSNILLFRALAYFALKRKLSPS